MKRVYAGLVGIVLGVLVFLLAYILGLGIDTALDLWGV